MNNTVWSLKADEQIMNWSTQQPHDWQIGGKCHAYLWGSGRHGQLGETGDMFATHYNIHGYYVHSHCVFKMIGKY